MPSETCLIKNVVCQRESDCGANKEIKLTLKKYKEFLSKACLMEKKGAKKGEFMSDIELVIANAVLSLKDDDRGYVPIALVDDAGGKQYATLAIKQGAYSENIDNSVIIRVKGERK